VYFGTAIAIFLILIILRAAMKGEEVSNEIFIVCREDLINPTFWGKFFYIIRTSRNGLSHF